MQPVPPNPILNFVPLIVIGAIFYFLLIRPQQTEMKQHKEMLAALKRGDRVLTSGGLYAVIVDIKGDDLRVKIQENVKILIAKSSVQKLIPEEEAKQKQLLSA